MQLVINTYGSYIRKRGECFEIKMDDRKEEVSARKVQSILITTGALISSDAILLAHENNIDVIFLDKYGNPFSRIWHSKFGSTAFIRRRQLECSESIEGLQTAISWIVTKIENQIELLNRLKKTRESKKEKIQEYVESMSQRRDNLLGLKGENISEVRDEIFSNEAIAGKLYFQIVSYLLPEKYQFSGRSKRPAKDHFNAFLNYGYGILYSKVEKACIIAGLDPFIGFLHTDNYNKKSLVFDIIELFRYHVDEVVIKLFSKRMVKQDMCREIKNGLTLEKQGKELLIHEFNKEMENAIRYSGRNIKKKNTIQFECHKIANNLIGEK